MQRFLLICLGGALGSGARYLVSLPTARWVSSEDPKRLEAFRKANQDNLALDAEGNLAYLAASEWRLEFVMEKWPEIDFLKTREHD